MFFPLRWLEGAHRAGRCRHAFATPDKHARVAAVGNPAPASMRLSFSADATNLVLCCILPPLVVKRQRGISADFWM